MRTEMAVSMTNIEVAILVRIAKVEIIVGKLYVMALMRFFIIMSVLNVALIMFWRVVQVALVVLMILVSTLLDATVVMTGL